jgi:hypothetical protein
MDVRRRLKTNSINIEINECDNFIKRSKETIGRLKHTNLAIEFVKNQIDKLNNSITEKEDRLDVLNNMLSSVKNGGLDNEINSEYKNNEIRQSKLDRERKNDQHEARKEKQEGKDASQAYWNGIIQSSRDHRQQERDVRYCQKYFDKTCDGLPDFIKRNLSQMPNNKGYIWKGVNFYGDLPEHPGPRVLFEKRKGGLLIIHEHTDKEYKVYQKNGKERKKLIEKHNKKKKQAGVNIMDYLKK